jgi:hypothetical protein
MKDLNFLFLYKTIFYFKINIMEGETQKCLKLCYKLANYLNNRTDTQKKE